jgi:hypothetical protein
MLDVATAGRRITGCGLTALPPEPDVNTGRGVVPVCPMGPSDEKPRLDMKRLLDGMELPQIVHRQGRNFHEQKSRNSALLFLQVESACLSLMSVL